MRGGFGTLRDLMTEGAAAGTSTEIGTPTTARERATGAIDTTVRAADALGRPDLARELGLVRERLLDGVELEPLTPRTITARTRFREEVAAVGAQGFAVADEEHELGVRSVAVPVLGPAGHAVAALAVSSPAYRTTVAGAVRLVPVLRAAAEHLAVLLPQR